MTQLRSLLVPEIGRGTPLDEAVSRTISQHTLKLTGTAGGSAAALLARLHQQRQQPIAILTPDANSARALVNDLSYHQRVTHRDALQPEVLFFPPFDLSPYDELAPDRNTVMQRASVLFHLSHGTDWRFVVIPAQSILRRFLPPGAFKAACLRISTGQQVDREQIISTLERGGYYRTPLVEEAGTYAIRGSLIDLFPSYLPGPVRVDLFGSTVEGIRVFDPSSQASKGEISAVWIHSGKIGRQTGGQQ